VDPRGLLEFLRLHRLAIEASVSGAGAPQAAVVGFAITDQFEIVFDTLESTRKAQNLRGHPKIAFVVGGLVGVDERTVQYEGVADEPSGAELDRLRKMYYAAYRTDRVGSAGPASSTFARGQHGSGTATTTAIPRRSSNSEPNS
jgi:hypothetical protein